MSQRALFGFLASLLVSVGCHASTAPYDDLESRLEVDRTRVAGGEVLGLRAIATNHGDRAIVLGDGCGAGLDFEVRHPNGQRQFLLPDVPSICSLFDSGILEPGETDTLPYTWTVPQPTGTYRVWAGGRVPEGLVARSAPVDVIVE